MKRVSLPGSRAGLALVALAIGGALVPVPAAIVESAYSDRFYAALQPVLTSASNRVPIALLDLLVLLVAVAWVVLVARTIRRAPTWLRGIGAAALRTTALAAGLYLAFLLVWGFNYRRLRLMDKVQFDAAAITPDAAMRAAAANIERLNQLYTPAHATPPAPADAIDRELAAAFGRAVTDLEGRSHVTPGRPKRTLFDWYFRRAGVDGMTDPFFLEILIASDILPVERPFVVAHEWSHLAGVADEGEANFVAWLSCMQGSEAHRYSGALFLHGELSRSLDRQSRARVSAALAGGPRADLRAMSDRALRNVDPRVAAAGWRVYDSYLKANRVEAGAASYGEVVQLVLGVKFADGFKPLRR